MSQGESATEKRKEELIMNLIDCGVYKVNGRQLHELTLSEVEEQIKAVNSRKVQ